MPRARVSDDLDHVTDEPTTTKVSKSAVLKRWPMSNFRPLKIKKGLEYGLSKLPVHVSNDSHVIFSLFFTEIVFQELANNTNRYVVNHFHHDDDDKSYVRT